MLTILFLDIDGVLNRHKRQENNYCGIEPECVHHLNIILNEFPHLMVVLSSSWRYITFGGHMSIEGLRSMFLTHGLCLNGHLLSTTCSDEHIATREKQIQNWLETNMGTRNYNFAVLDDLPLDLPLSVFVRTDAGTGLTEMQAQEVIAILKGRTW